MSGIPATIRLRAFALATFGLCLPLQAGTPRFTDAGLAMGVGAWHQPAPQWSVLPVHLGPMTGGGVVADFNRDGWQDLFLLTGGGDRDYLFINDGDGTFTERGMAWGLVDAHLGIGASVGDFNADGWPDIFVTSLGLPSQNDRTGRHRLYRNNGDGTFTNVAHQAGVNRTTTAWPDGFGSTWGDYDLDGDLDLFVCGWIAVAGGNRLFRNEGDGTFTDATVESGLEDLRLRGFSPVFHDMNGDRHPELLVAGDFHQSRLYRNNINGTFTNITQQSGTGRDDNGMGQIVADLNGDGLPDWYVTSVYTDRFPTSDVPGTGNMLYINTGGDLFAESSGAAGVKDGGWGWGTIAIDIDHDADLDLLETNGWMGTNANAEQEWMDEPSYVFQNNSDGTFTEIALQCGLEHTGQGRALFNADFDNDGDQDVVVVGFGERVRVYRNDVDVVSASDANWLRAFLDTSGFDHLAPGGLGARVSIRVDGAEQHRWIHAGSNYLSQSECSAHFGLGASTTVDELRVTWPDGRVRVVEHLNANQTLTVRPARAGDANADGIIDTRDVIETVLALGRERHPADADASGVVDVLDLTFVIWRLGS